MEVEEPLEPGAVATYSCSSGHSLGGGTRERVCLEGGVWSGTEPRCVRESAIVQTPPEIMIKIVMGVNFSCMQDFFLLSPDMVYTSKTEVYDTVLHEKQVLIGLIFFGSVPLS